MSAMSPDLSYLTDLIRSRTGIVIAPEKEYLLRSRLRPIASAAGLADVEDLAKSVRSGGQAGLIPDILDAMTTNESLFFRDGRPFEFFKQSILPDYLSGARKLRIWSMACSSGQEPYSLATILLDAQAKHPDLSFSIYATDISETMIARARQGRFSEFECSRGLPDGVKTRYFDIDGRMLQAKPALREQIRFEVGNLLDPFPGHGRYDLVLCRNVLIYFDLATKRDILNKIARITPSGAHLFLGSAETVSGLSEAFASETGWTGVYRRL